MALFFVRLVAQRPNFISTMTPEDLAVMKAHSAFLGEELKAGRLVVTGPVLDPAGAFGMAVFETASLDEVRALLQRDPARAIGRHEISPMGPNSVCRKAA